MSEQPVPYLAYPYTWQQEHWINLYKQHQQGRLHHALLLVGPQNIGKQQFATALAHMLMCEHKTNDQACGECHTCLLNKAATHPDLLQLEPEGSSAVIKIDQIRQVVDFISRTSQQGGYKIVILTPAERMNPNASNALLKSLEEPTDKTLLILVSHQISGLLATIRSRCLKISFAIPEHSLSLPWLQSLLVDGQDPVQCLSMARGAPIKALRLSEHEQQELRELMYEGLTGLLKHQLNPIEVAANWMQYAMDDVYYWLVMWSADLLKFSMTEDEMLICDTLLLKVNKYLAQRCSHQALINYAESVNQSWQLVRGRGNINKQLLLENILYAWQCLSTKRVAVG